MPDVIQGAPQRRPTSPSASLKRLGRLVADAIAETKFAASTEAIVVVYVMLR